MGRLMWHYQVLFLFLLIVSAIFCVDTTKLCPPEQSFALLQFKNNNLVDSSSYYYSPRPYNYSPRPTSWMGKDCCSWDGVTCDKVTGNVIGLELDLSSLSGTIQDNSSLFNLVHLQWLNLAKNSFTGSPISSKFGQFRELTSLNLSCSGFYGSIPSEISHLSKLVSLDISQPFLFMISLDLESSRLTLDHQNFISLAHNLTRLNVLYLDHVHMYSVEPTYISNLSFSVTALSLIDTGMKGQISEDVFRFPNLQELYLIDNEGLGGHLPKSNWSSPLRFLTLGETSFEGKIPDSIGNLKNLEKMDIQNCKFTGSVPASIGNLTRLTTLLFSSNYFSGSLPTSLSQIELLTELDFSNNSFSGQLPPFIFNLTQLISPAFSYNRLTGSIPSYVNGHSRLSYVDLSNNFFCGRIPSWLFKLPSLQIIHLENNNLTGPLDEFELPNSLEEVNLNNNRINGSVPNSIFKLASLISLDLSSNNFSGIISFDELSKLENLSSLHLSQNSLLSISSTNNVNLNLALPSLRTINFSFCNVREFPNFLGIVENLERLDLSNNKIHGRISNSKSKGWKNLGFLNLSQNFVTHIEQHPWENIDILDVSNNLIEGSISIPPPSTRGLLASNNKLTVIPPSICNLSSLQGLDLSNNNLGGKIPQCLGNSSIFLSILHLRNNNLHGQIPATFDDRSWLKFLDLNGNKLEGPLPESLVNCSGLKVINLGNNKIRDTFPHWLEDLSELKILVLTSNKFYGPISDSKTISSFSKLQVLDLSFNEFTGGLPRAFFGNLTVLMNTDVDKSEGVRYIGWKNYYKATLAMAMKGQKIEMERVLTIFTAIDMSNNQFQGKIPEIFGDLKSLVVLNLSSNCLVGTIPLSFGNLKALESLDLSSNKLDGRIPEDLRSLTFLSTLNISYNQLSGRIPQGNQFNTFGNDSFVGNKGLCGEPLTVKCGNNGASELPSTDILNQEDDTVGGFNWKIAMMGYASGLVIGVSIGYIVFSTGKPEWLVRMVESDRLQKKVTRVCQRKWKRRST